MVTRNISSVPVVTMDGKSISSFDPSPVPRTYIDQATGVLLNVFEAVDVIEILRSGDYGNLTWSVGRALSERAPNHPGIFCCSVEDGLDTIFDTIRQSRVHRLAVVDEQNILKGVLSLSDILHYILVDGEEEVGPNESDKEKEIVKL